MLPSGTLLIEAVKAAGVSFANLYTGSSEVGATATYVGYGSTGTGVTGNTVNIAAPFVDLSGAYFGPDDAARLTSGPITITETTQVRARVFAADGTPGRTASHRRSSRW